MGWPIYAHHTKEVCVANKETMTISGIARIWLRVGKRQIKAEILVSPDFKGLILGYDWLHRQGSFEWDFPRERIRLGRGNWVNMQDDEPLVKVRRIVATSDVVIPAWGQVTENAHILHNAWSCTSESSQYGVMESQPVTTMEHVYSGRVLLPMAITALQVPVLLRTPTYCTMPGAARRNHRNTASWKVNPLRPWNTYIADESYCPWR